MKEFDYKNCIFYSGMCVIIFLCILILSQDKRIEVVTLEVPVSACSAEITVEPVLFNIGEQVKIGQEKAVSYNLEEVNYLAKCVEAEAGNQSFLGKRLVVDVILNRVDNKLFPNNVIDVINAPSQFTVVSSGEINKAVPSSETFKAIEMEIEHRTDSDILYFTSTGYLSTPCYKLDAHYFGK